MPSEDPRVGWERTAQDEAEARYPPAVTPDDAGRGRGLSAVVLVVIVVLAVVLLLVVVLGVLPDEPSKQDYGQFRYPHSSQASGGAATFQ